MNSCSMLYSFIKIFASLRRESFGNAGLSPFICVNVYGLVSRVISSGTAINITDCFWDTETTGKNVGIGSIDEYSIVQVTGILIQERGL